MKTENKNWPDKARLKMIDIPESYPIYKHGFNDGYQYKGEECQKYKEMIFLINDYATFLGKIIDNNSTFLWAHGIKATNEEIQKGIEFRDKIEQLKKELQ